MNADLAQRIKAAERSRLEAIFALQIKAAGLPAPEREYRFDPARKWRLDFYFAAARLGVELQGGTWLPRGGHSTGRGQQRDMEKANACTLAGIRMLYFSTDDVTSGRALTTLEAALAAFAAPEPSGPQSRGETARGASEDDHA